MYNKGDQINTCLIALNSNLLIMIPVIMNARFFLSLSRITLPVATVLIMMIWAIPANAQQSIKAKKGSTQAVAIITRYDVKNFYQKQFSATLHNYVVFANKYQSNIMAELYIEQDSLSVFWVIERWASDNDYKKIHHVLSFKNIAALAKTALIKPASAISVVDIEPLPAKDWRKAPANGDEPLTVMLFVDAKPGTQDKFKDVYHVAMPQFRSERGVINYQLSQFKNDKTRFVTYEKFRNEDAFQYHLNFPPIQPVIDYLNTSIRKQPFQLGLHKLKIYRPPSY